MYKKNLVTLMVPFFNSEIYLKDFLSSVIKQTYKNIQLILINDGSSDGSDGIVKLLEKEIKKEITEFIYVSKENGGAASAINLALKYVQGEYLCWADSDDYMYPDSIKYRFEFLKNHLEYGMVISGAQSIDEKTGKILNNLSIPKKNQKENMFEVILSGIPCYSGVAMVRTEILYNILKGRDIFFHKEIGQNYQLMLPVAYYSKCGFIDNILYTYKVRKDSHSHVFDFDTLYKRTFITEKALDEILFFVEKKEKKEILEKIHKECEIERFNLTFKYLKKDLNEISYQKLYKNRYLTAKLIIKRYIIKYKVLYFIFATLKNRR